MKGVRNMSSFIAELPQKWERKTPFVAYELVVWHNKDTYADEQLYYTDVEDAISVLRSRIAYDGTVEMATIRQETIYRRNPKCEMSTSSPLIHYDRRKGVSL